MGKFDKYAGKGKEYEIEGEKYNFVPLGSEYIPDFLTMSKAFIGNENSNEDEAGKNFMKSMDDKTMSSIQRLIEATVRDSYPEDWNKDQQACKRFCMVNFMRLMEIVMELNQHVDDEKKKNRIEKIKQSRNQDVEPNTKS